MWARFHLAGAVQARSTQTPGQSDWMELNRRAVIWITSTMLQFDYQGRGSISSTRRATRTSAKTPIAPSWPWDSAVMVLDGARVSSRSKTKKLFCRVSQTRDPHPDLHQQDGPAGPAPFDLLDEIERTLGMTAVPFNWPIGEGSGFQGRVRFSEPPGPVLPAHLAHQRRAAR